MIQVRFLLGTPTGIEPVAKGSRCRKKADGRTPVARSAILPGDEVFLLGTPVGVLGMKNKAVKIGIIASILPHLFCCVLPIVLSIVGLFAPEIAHAEFIPHWVEPWLFVFSALMLALSWFLVVRDCHCHCEHCDDAHGHSHRPQKIILGVITAIFIISIILHLIAHH